MGIWLGLERDAGGWTVFDSGCVRQILEMMDHPREQYPSIQLFVGRTTQRQALRSLYPDNNIGRHSRHGLARLYLSNLGPQRPTMFIDSSLSEHVSTWPHRPEPLNSYHVQNSHSLSIGAVQNLLFQRVLLPIADTVCLFAADLGGITGVLGLLRAWSESPLMGLDGTSSVRPRLIVALTESHDPPDHGVEVASILQAIAVPTLATSLSVVDLRNREPLSPVARFAPLQRRLLQELDTARATRAAGHLLFSAAHLEWIVKKMLLQLTTQPASPFNCIRACRPSHPPDEHVSPYLQIFLEAAGNAGQSAASSTTFVASALLMDAYPPGMHDFDPIIMFRTHYAAHCVDACSRIRQKGGTMTPAQVRDLCQGLERTFASMFIAMSPTKPSAYLRRNVFRAESCIWSTVQSHLVCLFCLRRPPEHVLSCGHAMCDTCVVIFGTPARGAEYHFALADCPLCFAKISATVRVLPPTKWPMILVLDGGGTRGVISLAFLKALNHRIGGSRGLREAFDLTVATSVGAVIAAEAIIRGAPIDEVDGKFRIFGRKVFPLRAGRESLWGKSWDMIRTCLSDSRYDSDVLEQTIQEAIDPTRLLFDTTAPLVSGIRVALTASQVDDGSLCLLPNYRGVGRCQIPSAYQALVSDGPEPQLWKVIRCAVAALGYFTPKALPGIGTLQDGGVRANCPLRAALRESHVIWPRCTRPDLVLNIGTGYSSHDPAFKDRDKACPFRDGFVQRAIRTFLSSPAVDGRHGWEDALDSISPDILPHVFRLDRMIDGKLPELDDARVLDDFDEWDYRIPDDLVRSWLARSFFFELDDEPTKAAGHYICRGSILCCKYDAPRLVQQIEAEFHGARFVVSNSSDLGAVKQDEGCQTCGYYRFRASFRVTGLQEKIQLDITGATGSSPIGGFPTSIQCLLEDQQADSLFGRTDHRSHPWSSSRQCYCTGRKRVAPSTEMKRASKRQRRS